MIMKIVKILLLVVFFFVVVFIFCKKDDDNNIIISFIFNLNIFKVCMMDLLGNFFVFNIMVIKVEVYVENQGWLMLDLSNYFMNVFFFNNGMEIILVNKFFVMVGYYIKLCFIMGNNSLLMLNDQFGDNNYNFFWSGVSNQIVEVIIDVIVIFGLGVFVLLDYNVG